jgi:hypothetical protein
VVAVYQRMPVVLTPTVPQYVAVLDRCSAGTLSGELLLTVAQTRGLSIREATARICDL